MAKTQVVSFLLLTVLLLSIDIMGVVGDGKCCKNFPEVGHCKLRVDDKVAAASTSSPSQFQSASIPVLVQPAVSQSTQCSSESQSSAPIPVSNTSIDPTVHVEEQLPLADGVALLLIEEHMSLAGTDSITPVMHASPALNTETENVATPTPSEPVVVTSTDQQVAAESSEQPGDSANGLQVDHTVDDAEIPGS
ncbi:hypothetical protein V6N12_001185 [Hibiscus sabdariffa]|uniref:Uncharacterized protein n=1 Tax=Hibiscus sabdariffa TaxID=183260 RepID=A0ABR2C6H7_9ROSI